MKGIFMKKVKPTSDKLRTEYKRSDFGKLERGKYYERVKASSNVVVLDAEVAAVFPNSAAVNKALHSLVDVAGKARYLLHACLASQSCGEFSFLGTVNSRPWPAYSACGS